MKRLLFIDNFDSFTYNVVHLLATQGADVTVLHNDARELNEQTLQHYHAVVVGPGPGTPAQKPRMMELLARAIDKRVPTFGVCLGLQAIGEACGARVTHAPSVMHGKVSRISHDGRGVFKDVPQNFSATRYHSLCVEEAGLPASLCVTARSEDGVVQGVRHADAPVHAVQFHPESVLSEYGERIAANFLALVR